MSYRHQKGASKGDDEVHDIHWAGKYNIYTPYMSYIMPPYVSCYHGTHIDLTITSHAGQYIHSAISIYTYCTWHKVHSVMHDEQRRQWNVRNVSAREVEGTYNWVTHTLHRSLVAHHTIIIVYFFCLRSLRGSNCRTDLSIHFQPSRNTTIWMFFLVTLTLSLVHSTMRQTTESVNWRSVGDTAVWYF